MKSPWRGRLVTPALVALAVVLTYTFTTIAHQHTDSLPLSQSAPANTAFGALATSFSSLAPKLPSLPKGPQPIVTLPGNTAAIPTPVHGPALHGPYTLDPNAALQAGLDFPPLAAAATNTAAIRTATAQVQAHPDSVDALDDLTAALLAGADRANGLANLQRADAILDHAFTLQSDDYRANVYRGMARLAQGRYAEAAVLTRQAILADPTTPELYAVLGNALVGLGHYRQAAAAFQALSDRNPGILAFTRNAMIRASVGDQTGADQYARMAVEAAQKTHAAPTIVAWVQTQLGDSYFTDGAGVVAEAQYAAALKTNPNEPTALAGLAYQRIGEHRAAEAIDLARRAVTQAPLPANSIALADLYHIAGKPALAQAAVAQARAAFARQAAHGLDVRLDRALFEAEYAQVPPDAVAVAYAALAGSLNLYTQDKAAWLLYKAGRFQEALKAEDQALAHGALEAALYFHEGMILAAINHNQEGLNFLHQAIMINPNFSLHYVDTPFTEMKRLSGLKG